MVLIGWILHRRNDGISRDILRAFVIAAVALVIFRIFQPYAFQSAAIWNFRLSSDWLAAMHELAQQSAGKISFPPAWQWAGRLPGYAFKNLFLFGFGLPLSLLILVGIGCLMLRKGNRTDENRQLALLIVLGTGIVLFCMWQLTQFSQMMRYLYPICPLLLVLAGGGLADALQNPKIRVAIAALTGVLLVAALFYALAFTNIYRSQHTRLVASQWIYKQVPSGLTLEIDNLAGEERFLQRLSIPAAFEMRSADLPIVFPLSAQMGDHLRLLELADVQLNRVEGCSWDLKICRDASCKSALTQFTQSFQFGAKLVFPDAITAETPTIYLGLSVGGERCSASFSGAPAYMYLIRDGAPRYLLVDLARRFTATVPLEIDFSAESTGSLKALVFGRLQEFSGSSGAIPIQVSLTNYRTGEVNQTDLDIPSGFFDAPVSLPITGLRLQRDEMYKLRVAITDPTVQVRLSGEAIGTETVWDERLPLVLDGRLPFDPNYGLYRMNLDLDLFAAEDLLYREKLLAKLAALDTLIISSNRVYGALDQALEVFPLAATFYRQLIDCPSTKMLSSCFRALDKDSIGSGQDFQLAAVFESEPRLLGIRIPTQSAEEAFTVYDHPKVFVFQKTARFSLDRFRTALDAVNLSEIPDKIPVEYKSMELNGMFLSAVNLLIQRAGGTWSELFNRTAWINKNQIVTLLAWYAAFWLLGIAFFPLTRRVFSGLRDKGYGVSRLFGLLIFGYLVWIAAFTQLHYERRTLCWIAGFFALLNLALFLKDRAEIVADLRQRRKEMLQSELVFLVCFTFFVLIRLGNPDLWHPYKGGEKPMDFSYFNAVLKSVVFPPYDPWFAGGTLNYYYYGFFSPALW